MQTVAVIDYGSGNLRSAAKALERAAAEADVPARVLVTDLIDEVRAADRVVLPGVGAFADCFRGLAGLAGMREALEETVIDAGRPFLGICVGMQLMAREGREHEVCPGLGWIDGEVVAIEPDDPGLKVPHMGWNEIRIETDPPHPVLKGLDDGAHVYFVHSYHLRPRDRGAVLATADYGGEITAAAGRDNLIGTQFHPEKSQAAGLTLLTNFLRWRP